jgi:hypothetical protein
MTRQARWQSCVREPFADARSNAATVSAAVPNRIASHRRHLARTVDCVTSHLSHTTSAMLRQRTLGALRSTVGLRTATRLPLVSSSLPCSPAVACASSAPFRHFAVKVSKDAKKTGAAGKGKADGKGKDDAAKKKKKKKGAPSEAGSSKVADLSVLEQMLEQVSARDSERT